MAVVNGYCTLPELKAWLRFDPEDLNQPHPDDALFENAISASSRWIDSKCKRHFYQVVEQRELQPDDAKELLLPHFHDLVSVTSIVTDDYPTWTVDDYVLHPRNAAAAPEPRPYRSIVAISRYWRGTAKITGTWGWPAVPDAIKTACKIQAARTVKRREAPEGVLGLGQFGITVRLSRSDPDVLAAVQPYRLRSLG